MALLSSVFPAINFSPDIYYALLDDLREDFFMAAINKVCVEVTELFPNTNLVALIRQKYDECFSEVAQKKIIIEQKRQLDYQEPDYSKSDEARKEWLELKAKLAKETGKV